jgi:excinuclease UvrABC nuclease subunit
VIGGGRFNAWPDQPRYASLRREQERDGDETASSPPEFLLIDRLDGGKGQLLEVMVAFTSLGQRTQKVVALTNRGELVSKPEADEPLRLSRHGYADEVHRFAQHIPLLRRRS